ncbi:MAG: YciI family protein [Rhodobacteraceae bacterium]|jgi:hypothetical protein|nr:YciI family protein [Paracoccaceae bacterium]
MQYMILCFETAEDFARRDNPETAGAYWAGWSAYGAALAQAGVMVGGAGLLPPSAATTVRIRNEARDVQDGPYADAKEQLGGYFTIEVPDLDTALDWAAKAPSAATASAEVRPVMPMNG